MTHRNFTDSEEEQIAKIYSSGKSARAIAHAYGLGHHISIVDALRRQGAGQRPVSDRNRIHKLNPNAFDVIDNEAAAYWWGFLYADGYISRDKVITITLSQKDKEQLEKFKIFMDTEAPVSFYGIGKGNSRINITDKHLAARLKQLGILTGRPNPKQALDQIPDSLFHHWLRGLFDGDGSARKSPSIVLCGGYDFLYVLRSKISEHCEVNPLLSISKHRASNLHYLYYSGRLMALKVADYMYKGATVWMKRKRDVIESWPLPQSRKKG